MLAERLINLSGKVAVITGGAGGIGRGSAEMLASAGADVALLDIKAEAASEAASEISSKYGVKAVGYKCDVMSEADQEEVIKAAAADFGTINIVVNKQNLIHGFIDDKAGTCHMGDRIFPQQNIFREGMDHREYRGLVGRFLLVGWFISLDFVDKVQK